MTLVVYVGVLVLHSEPYLRGSLCLFFKDVILVGFVSVFVLEISALALTPSLSPIDSVSQRQSLASDVPSIHFFFYLL